MMFSKKKVDRFRYDNYDDKWIVNTRPHHFHPRGQIDAIESPMIGNPIIDIPLLVNFIEKNKDLKL